MPDDVTGGGAYAGEIRIRSRIDTHELTSDTAKLQAQMDKVVHKLQELNDSTKISGLENRFQAAQRETAKYGEALDRVRAKLQELRDNEQGKTLHTRTYRAEMALEQRAREMAEIQREIQNLESGGITYANGDSIKQQMQADLAAVEQRAAAIDRYYRQYAAEEAKYNAQREASIARLSEQETALTDKITTARERETLAGDQLNAARETQEHRLSELAQEYERYGLKLDEVRAKEALSTGSAQTVTTQTVNNAKQVAQQTRSMATSAHQGANGFEKLSRRIAGLAKRVFIFSVITSAFRKIRSFIQQVAQTVPEFTQALREIRGNLLTAFQPIWEFIQPAVVGFFQFLAKVTRGIAAIISKIFGKSLKDSALGARKLHTQMSAVNVSAKETTHSVKTLKKELAGFDEITQLSDNGMADGVLGGLGADTPEVSNEPIFPYADSDLAFMRSFEEFWEALKNTPAFQRVAAAWETLKTKWGELKQTLIETGAWDKIKNTFERVLPTAFDVGMRYVEGSMDTLSHTIGAVSKAAEGDWGGAANEIKNATTEMISTPILGLSRIFDEVFGTDLTSTLEQAKQDFEDFDISTLFNFKQNFTAIGAFLSEKINEWVSKTRAKVDQFAVKVVLAFRSVAQWFLDTFVNSFIDGVNFLIDKLNNFKVTIPAIIAKVFGWQEGTYSVFNLQRWSHVKLTVPGTRPGQSSGMAANGASNGTRGIPALAQGAVIPPNSPFLAMLGDQRHGTNIEAPLDTIVDAFLQAQSQMPPVEIVFGGSLAQLAKVLHPVIKREGDRLGDRYYTRGGGYAR